MTITLDCQTLSMIIMTNKFGDDQICQKSIQTLNDIYKTIITKNETTTATISIYPIMRSQHY